MSDAPVIEAGPGRKGKGLLAKLLVALVLLGVGGGGAFALISTGVLGNRPAAKQDNTPKLVRKGEADPYAPAEPEGKGEAAGAEIHGDGGSEYRTAYFRFADDFTTNLKDSQTLVQVSLACSTRRDGRVLAWLKTHELAIRSELLAVLADTPEEDVATPEGKQRLQTRLTTAINKVLIAHEGFGGIDAVYFKSFIIQ